MISFAQEGNRFDLRTAGIIIDGGKLLVCYFEGASYYYVPGGRVDHGEDSREALQRELHEELGISATVGRLLWVTEHFYRNDQDDACHEIGFYYEVPLGADQLQRIGAEPISIEDGDQMIGFSWLGLDELAAVTLYPEFLTTSLRELPAAITHLVENR